MPRDSAVLSEDGRNIKLISEDNYSDPGGEKLRFVPFALAYSN